MGAILISADEIKKELPGYTPDHAGDFHVESAKRADRQFEECLEFEAYNSVILLSGGPASGKTEYVSEYLSDQQSIILDGILPTEKGADIKIRNARKYGKRLAVHALLPKDLRLAYAAFLGRERKFDDVHFYEKHSSARRTLLWIAKHCPEVDIKMIESAYVKNDLVFNELLFGSRATLIDFLSTIQYTSDDIVNIIRN